MNSISIESIKVISESLSTSLKKLVFFLCSVESGVGIKAIGEIPVEARSFLGGDPSKCPVTRLKRLAGIVR